MYKVTVSEVIEALELYEIESKKLDKLKNETKEIANSLDLDEVKSKLSYLKSKELFNSIKYKIDNEKRTEFENILKDKKVKEYPEILDVHYYPIIKDITFLNSEEKIKLDQQIKECFYSNKSSVSMKLEQLDSKILDHLITNNIIERQYIFHCTCGSVECYDKVISQERFDKLKDYWRKEEEGIDTTPEEDKKMNYGCFETGCWNDGTVEICSLDDFNKNLRRIDYKVIKEPNMTLDNI